MKRCYFSVAHFNSMKKVIHIFLFVTVLSGIRSNVSAAILGGEITYRHVSGLTYEIAVTIYSSTIPVLPPTLDSVNLGDGSIITMILDSFIDFPHNVRASYFVETHTYVGAGTYTLWLSLPARSGDIINIPNSAFVPFAIASELKIPAITCPNSSVKFGDKPVFFGQKNKPARNNLTILNPDHDSLTYAVVQPFGLAGQYFFPSQFTLDQVSGELTTVGLPDSIGKYDFAIKVTEWRNGWQVGYVIRDYVLQILPDTDNAYYFTPLGMQQDTGGNYFLTVNPGDSISFNVEYTDTTGMPSLNAFSEAFHVGEPAYVSITSGSPISKVGSLTWVPHSMHARNYPYLFSFRGSSSIRQTDQTVLIYVNGLMPDSCYDQSWIGYDELLFPEDFISVYPNPATNDLSIVIPPTMKGATLFVFDSFGKLVTARKSFLSEEQFHTNNYPEGIYFVKIQLGGKSQSAKFCISHH